MALFAASSGSCTAAGWASCCAPSAESPTSAHSIGYPVIGIRYLATIFGGAMAGLGGAFLSVYYTPLWVEGMIAGRGWIALALVVFLLAAVRVLMGAYLFGGITILRAAQSGAGRQASDAQLLSTPPPSATYRRAGDPISRDAAEK